MKIAKKSAFRARGKRNASQVALAVIAVSWPIARVSAYPVSRPAAGRSMAPARYIYYPNSDVMSTGETIFPQRTNASGNVSALSTLCDVTPSCVGFNTHGWLKNGSSSLGPAQVDTYLLPVGPAPAPPLPVWPAPVNASSGSTLLRVSSDLVFTATSPSADLNAAFMRVRSYLFPHTLVGTIDAAASLLPVLDSVIVDVADVSAPLQVGVDESYTLDIPADGTAARLTAATVFGAYHGLETLSQLVAFDYDLRAYTTAVSPVTISDAPRFAWRGLMVDPARRFLPVSVLRSIIDSMTFAKLNVLHFHAVDCDSWPIEIPGSNFSRLWAASFSPRERYTTGDLASLVEYGRLRGVRIVFEFDSPGHAGSMCTAYPELCPSPLCREPLSPASNLTIPAIATIISAFSAVSLDDVVHLGGDEVDPTCWKASPEVRNWMESMGYNSTDDVYRYFVARTNELALASGKVPMRWEEVWKHFRTQLDPRTIVHAWLSSAALADATNNGYRAVFSVNDDAYYLDYLDIQWDAVYSTDILAGVLNQSAHQFVLGGEVAMWGETVDAGTVLQTIWPRAAAAAERLWSYNFATSERMTAQSWGVVNRLAQFRCLLLERGVPAASPGNAIAGSMGPSWTVGGCGGGYAALC